MRNSQGQFSRQYQFNENYFSTINTESKAYWLGFIAADGCCYVNRKGGQKGLRIVLANKDLDHLDLLRQELEFPAPLKSNLKNNSIGLFCYSPVLFDNLVSKGIIPRKSLSLIYPDLNSGALTRHFNRGYFDGDGSFFLANSKYLCFELLGTHSFLTAYRDTLPTIVSEKMVLSLCRKSSETYRLRLFMSSPKRQHVIDSLYDYFYDDSSVYLGRKEAIIREFI